VVPNVAQSSDGGKTWHLTHNSAPIAGAIFGLAYARRAGEQGRDNRESHIVVATGPNGSAWTEDEGDSWTNLAGLSGLWAVAFANEEVGWLVGINGQIVQIRF
jgi:hypothetical protein